MATELGKAYIQIMPSAKGISGAISKQINPEATSAGTSAGGLMGSALTTAALAAVAIGAAAIGKMISSSLSEGAALQQSLGGIDTLFKDSAGKVKKYAEEAYRTTGLSANRYMESVTGFSASLLQSLGGDTAKAAKVANMAMIDMADNSNKMGTSMESIQYAYQGFSKSNYTMLDNLKLGYGGTKSEMERLLADAEKLTGVKYDLNNLSDVYEAIHAVQQELDITGTTSKEASQTFTGSFNAMKASAQDLLGNLSLGKDVTKSFNTLLSTAKTFFVDNFLPMLGNVFKGIGDIIVYSFSDIFPKIGAYLQANGTQLLQAGSKMIQDLALGILQNIPHLLTTVGQLFTNIVAFFLQNAPALLQAGAGLLLNIATGILQNLPAIVDSAVQVISGFISMLEANWPQFLQKGSEILGKLASGIIQAIPFIVESAAKIIASLVGGIISNLPKVINLGVQLLKSLVSGMISVISEIIGAAQKIGNTLVNYLENIDLASAGRAIIQGFLNGLMSKFEDVKGFVSGIAGWIRDNKGPIDYDRKLLIPAGQAIMYSLHDGLKDTFDNKVKPLVGSMADKLASNFGGPELAFDMSANVSSQVPTFDKFGNKLAQQATSTANINNQQYDIFEIIEKISKRPIFVSAQFDQREFARITARPMTEAQEFIKRADARLVGDIL
ncbi:PblA [Streptococcus iniae]|nr:PblA [Streptococcus iniae]